MTTKRNKLKNLHSRDRHTIYTSPTKRDVLCPHYEHKWVKLAHANYNGNDMVSVCHKPDANCDYKEDIVPGILTACRRYWKTNDQDFQRISDGLPQLPGNRQSIKLQYDLIRLFLNKVATVRMQLSKQEIRYANILSGTFNSSLEKWSEYGGAVDWTIYNGAVTANINVGHKAGLILKGMDSESVYQFRYTFYPTDNDNDTVGSIFRYNRTTKHYYSIEWNNGGMSPKGFSVKKNIYNKDTNSYTETILHTSDDVWGNGLSNRDVSVYVYEDSVRIQRHKRVWYPSHGHYHNEYDTINIPLTDSRLATGTYGLMTQSQAAYFNYFTGHITVESSIVTYNKQIDLSRRDQVGGDYILSDTMEDAFKADRDAFLQDNNIQRSELLRETYQVISSNVYESIEFDDRTKLTTNPNRKISMRTWDYDIPIPYEKVIDVTTHEPRTINHSYPIVKDVYVRGVVIEYEKEQFEDTFILDVGGRRIYNDGVTKEHWRTDFDEYINADFIFNIVFHYIVNDSPISFYWKHEHVDTHDKKFTIKENELGWHHIPSIETEADGYR